MIVWDAQNQEHIIRVGSSPYPTIKTADFAIPGNDKQVEDTIKTTVDSEIASANYHIYVHIFSKDPLSYVLWCGSKDQEPSAPTGYEWWEAVP